MGVGEIIAGSLLILSSLAIIVLVLLQEGKGSGLSGAIGGGMMENQSGRTRTTDMLMGKYTRIAAIVFFVLAIGVSVLNVLLK